MSHRYAAGVVCSVSCALSAWLYTLNANMTLSTVVIEIRFLREPG